MGKYVINGGKTLKGDIFISGAKNSVLPILAGAVLNEGTTVLKNVPMLLDTYVAIDILKSLGCFIKIEKNKLTIDSSNINKTEVPKELVSKMRSSIIFLGSLIARFKKAKISYPGGCKLGKRPIDFHINAFKLLNIDIEEKENIIATAKDIKGNIIELPFASVGATQNIMLVSVFAEGETIIKNCAKEPEMIDLQNFLNKMGASISGAGTDTIKIKGVKYLKKYVEHTIMPDRIEAGTFLCLACCNGGEITVKNVIPSHLKFLTDLLEKLGCEIEIGESFIKLERKGDIKNIDFLETAPYPLFPTDLQPQIMAVLCLAKGSSILKENIFEARNKHIEELNKMGANIKEDKNIFFIDGIEEFNCAKVFAKDLRGGACIIMAGLCAKGETTVFGSEYINRGYENLDKKLKNLGADIKYIED